MAGMIDQIAGLGLEREDLKKDHPKAVVGGARIPYPPKDLASLVSLLRPCKPLRYLALELHTMGGVEFLQSRLGYPETVLMEDGKTPTEVRKNMRTLEGRFDLVSLDGRGQKLSPDALWKYLEGAGKSAPDKAFGKGAPPDYGTGLLSPRAHVVVNLAEPQARELWYRLRTRYGAAYQSLFVGMVRI